MSLELFEVIPCSVTLLVLSFFSLFLNLGKWIITKDKSNSLAFILKMLCGVSFLMGSILLTIQFTALKSVNAQACTIVNQLGNYLFLMGTASTNFLLLSRLFYLWDHTFESTSTQAFKMSNVIIVFAVLRFLAQIAVFFVDPAIATTTRVSATDSSDSCDWGVGNAALALFAFNILITLFVTSSVSIILWSRLLHNSGKKNRERLPGVIKAFLGKNAVLIAVDVTVILAVALENVFGLHEVTAVLVHAVVHVLLVVVDWPFMMSLGKSKRKVLAKRSMKSVSESSKYGEATWDDLSDCSSIESQESQ